jgi:hypothetical protein
LGRVKDREDVLSLNYIGLMAPMVKAIQELKIENDTMAAQNRQLRQTVQGLTVRLQRLEELAPKGRAVH